MGYGDEIMAAGHARAMHRKTGKRVAILDVRGQPRWHPLWEGLPYIARPGEDLRDVESVRNGSECRPYIAYPFTVEGGQRFTAWRARDHIGEIAFSEAEFARARALFAPLLVAGFVVVEPNIRRAPGVPNVNKDWGFDRFQRVIDLLPGLAWVQLHAPGEDRILKGVRAIETPDFRTAAAIIGLARGALLTEGGLHHAAAVEGVPAVVLFGGSPSVAATGYPRHRNIAAPGEPCGSWRPCRHCRDFWDSLPPALVAEYVGDMLHGVPARRSTITVRQPQPVRAEPVEAPPEIPATGPDLARAHI